MKMDRLVAIVMLLLERRRVSAKSLAGMFEVSLRTIYRDLETINRAGVPIVSSPGNGGGFSLMEGYAVERKIFTDRDIAALLMGLGSIAAMSGPEGSYARAKIMSLLPEDRAREVALKSGQVVIDPTPWMGRDRTGPLLERIRTAMDEGRLVAFRYSDRKGLESERRVEPHRLVLKEGRWYLHGFCLEREDFRLFKPARMAGLQILEAAFEFREVPRSHSGFSDAMTRRETRITLRVQEALRDRLLDYCGPEDIRDCGDGRWLASFPFIADDFGYALLLSLGPGCECLAPPDVREEMRRRTGEMARTYGA